MKLKIWIFFVEPPPLYDPGHAPDMYVYVCMYMYVYVFCKLLIYFI